MRHCAKLFNFFWGVVVFFKAVIFDFDGVILDSEPQHQESFRRLFEKHGIAFSESADDFTGIGACDNIRRVFSKAKTALTDMDLEKLNRERDAIYLEVMKETGTHTLPGAKELLTALKAKKIPVALASSTNSSVLKKILPEIGLENTFDVVVGGDQVRNGKPAPDIFLLAAKKLEVEPRDCLVVEDSNAGVSGAKKAGMRVLMVRNGRIVQRKEKADAFVESLAGIDVRWLLNI